MENFITPILSSVNYLFTTISTTLATAAAKAKGQKHPEHQKPCARRNPSVGLNLPWYRHGCFRQSKHPRVYFGRNQAGPGCSR